MVPAAGAETGIITADPKSRMPDFLSSPDVRLLSAPHLSSGGGAGARAAADADIEGLSPKERQKLAAILASDDGEETASTPQQKVIRERIRSLMHELASIKDTGEGEEAEDPSLQHSSDRMARGSVGVPRIQPFCESRSSPLSSRSGVQRAAQVEQVFFSLLVKLREYILVDIAAILDEQWDSVAKPGCRPPGSAAATGARSVSIASSLSSTMTPQAMVRVEVARREKELEWKLCWHRACDEDTHAFQAEEREFAAKWSRLTSAHGKVLRTETVSEPVILARQMQLLADLRATAPDHLQRDPAFDIPMGLERKLSRQNFAETISPGTRSSSSHSRRAEERFTEHRRKLIRRAQDGYFPPAALSKLLGGGVERRPTDEPSPSLQLRGAFHVGTSDELFSLSRSPPRQPGATGPYSSAIVARRVSQSPERHYSANAFSPPSATTTYADNFRRQRLGIEHSGGPRERGPKWL